MRCAGDYRIYQQVEKLLNCDMLRASEMKKKGGAENVVSNKLAIKRAGPGKSARTRRNGGGKPGIGYTWKFGIWDRGRG
ncbi:hypothetical protein BOTBODRAFT_579821 [Botryobasidium botryosum FD-172 SS1]|uniref:Uncharacterized protein n=1 Tax=Botryobasidium botryosum (strain FD-172 SS1) TaxID=930990 RepID=A0A067MPI0_BOTB1|nr:hypothetical protein BOTBODRAFT_579821 [Botryobasidium botryosum FD-172 SS1]